MAIKLHPLPAAPSPGGTYLEQLQRRKSKGKQRQVEDPAADAHDDIDATLYAETGVPAVLQALRKVKLQAESPAESGIQALVYDDGDELAWNRSTLVWSHGTAIHRIYSFKEHEHGHIRQALFAYFEVPAPPSTSSTTSVSATEASSSSATCPLSDPSSSSASSDDSLIGAFAPTPPPAWSDDTRSSLASASIGASHTSTNLARVLCIFFAETLYLYFPDGPQHIIHLRFAIRNAWAMERGLLIERLHKPTLRDSLPDWLRPAELRNRGRQKEGIALYTFFDPFGDFSPFTKVSSLHNLPPSRHISRAVGGERKPAVRSGKAALFNNPSERTLFVSDRRNGQDPVLITFDTTTHKLSIWAYAEIGEDVQADFDAFRRRQTQLAEEEGYINASPGMSEDQASLQPTATLPVTGKRRRSQDYALNIGPTLPSAPPLHAQPRRVSALSTASGQTQLADRRRSSHMEALHPLPHAHPNNSVADFLQLMGTQPAVRQRSTQLATGQNRRSSTAASNISLAPHMDRRTSTTRNELSISLDRMALSSAAAAAAAAGGSSSILPPRSNTVTMHDNLNGNLQPHLPSLQGGEIGIAETLAEEAHSQSKDHPMGHGEMEREASVLLDDDDEVQERASEMNIARLASLKLDSLSLEDQSAIHCAIFDIRQDSSILAICLPSQQTVYLYHLGRAAEDAEEPGRLLCTPISQMDGLSISAVYATRKNIQDLAIVTSDGSLILLSADAIDVALALESTHSYAGIRVTRGSIVHLKMKESQKVVSVDLSCWTVHATVQEALDALAYILPSKAFSKIYLSFLQYRQDETLTSEDAEFSALRRVVVHAVSEAGPVQDALSDWEHLMSGAAPYAKRQFESSRPRLDSQVLQASLFALHLLKEEWSLLSRKQYAVELIVGLLADLATQLGLPDYLEASLRDGGSDNFACGSAQDRVIPPPHNVHLGLKQRLLRKTNDAPFDHLRALKARLHEERANFFDIPTSYPIMSKLIRLYDCWYADDIAASLSTPAEKLVLLCASFGWTAEDINEISLGPALPIREAIRQCQLLSPELWPKAAYALLARADQIAMVEGPLEPKKDVRASISARLSSLSELARTLIVTDLQIAMVKKRAQYAIEPVCDAIRNIKPISHPQHQVKKKVKEKATRFSSDLRLEDVQKMLQYTSHIIVRGPETAGIAESEIPDHQQKMLYRLAMRTLALPVGNAAFAYRMAQRPRSQMVSIPKVELSAKLLPHPGVLAPSADTLPPEDKTWSYFHSGVAIAVHVAWGTNDFDISEFTFNRPAELNARHAGFLLGLGLTGQIRSLGTYQAFKYMDPKHEYTSIGLLIGLGAAYVGTADPKVSSALSVHIAALHPANAAHLNVSMGIQSAALVGIGFLHISSRNRKIADSILRDMTRLQTMGTEHPDGCREGYALASGFSYGLVMLGRGNDEPALDDAEALKTFRYLLEAKANNRLPGTRAHVEGALDVTLTSPAAAVALALTFMRTSRQDVADMLEIPQSVDRLDHVRPDLVLLRSTCRSLIMWDDIKHTKAWIDSLVPSFISSSRLARQKTGTAVPYDQEVTYWNIIAGACLAVGLKYAGTAKGEAHATLVECLDTLCKTYSNSPASGTLRSKLMRHHYQTCISVMCLSLAAVMAGTGELNVLRRLRVMHGHISDTITYGTHLASHLALGLLFLGKGRFTLGTSKLATAALLLAFYPVFPSTPSENRFHLQAFRHLWVLAVEPRCLVARDVDSGKSVYIPLKLRVKEQDESGMEVIRSSQLVAPTLIPDIKTIESIRTDSPRYWPVTLAFGSSAAHLKHFLRTQTIFVKRRAGHLSYAHDPRGIRSVFTQAKSEIGSIVYDDGTVTQLFGSPSNSHSAIAPGTSASSPIVKAYHRILCEAFETDSKGARTLVSFLQSVMMECSGQDKPEAVLLYRALYAALQASTTSIAAVKDISFAAFFYSDQVFSKLLGSVNTGRRQPLIQKSFIESVVDGMKNCSNAFLVDGSFRNALRQGLQDKTVPLHLDNSGEARSMLGRLLEDLATPSFNILQNLCQYLQQAKQHQPPIDQAILRKGIEAVLKQSNVLGGHVDQRLVDVLLSL